ncbi:MAG: class I SAM-dependent methyltransferase [Alphaproteobacteria bacterium]|nr:class I SAM-dependent methyltransferase [Alphaproteobacteria bacterium]
MTVPQRPIAPGESWTAAIDRIGGYFDALVARFGPDMKGIDYGGRETQRVRFEIIADSFALAGKRVLDVGCGFADLADFLAQRSPGVGYVGVDISRSVLAEARRRRPDLDLRRLDILAEDPGGPFDVVVANGIFYLLGAEGEARMRALIGRMFALCREGVVFTSLSSWAPRQQPGEFHADPSRTVDFCRGLTPYLRFRHDYLPHDFAVCLYRGQVPV